jgi:acyl-CoA synthetase (AMP-forming)/AMP-acid ligase II
VMLSHRNLFLGADSVAEYLILSDADTLLCVLPFSFDAGLNQLISAFKVGATAVLLDHLFTKEVITALETYRITGLGAVPPLWIQLADLDLSRAAKTLRFISNTGGRMPKAVLEKLVAQLPETKIYLMYGLTEAFRSAYLDPALVDARPHSVGKAIPHATLRIVRPDGTETAAGETGELVHAGALVAMGYWNDAERTAQRFKRAPDCFPDSLAGTPAVFSGDSFVRDADGYLYFVGRDDEMIKTSGYRVSPTEIEEALYETGDVLEAVATGLPDARIGAVIAVAIVLKTDMQDSAALIQQKLRDSLPGFMQPKYIDVWTDFPRSPNGKLDRVEITRALTEKLLQDAA